MHVSIEKIIEAIAERIPSVLFGFLMLFIGSYLIRLINRIVHNRFEKRDVDPSLREFVASLLRFILYTMLVISVASTMGFKTTSFLAVLSAASLAIGLSLQGSLSNFAGGVLILLFKPFRVGDSIQTAAGANGVVERIDILYTTLRTADGIAVFSPNGILANSVITNFSDIRARRIEYKITISSKEDVKKVRNLVLEVLQKDERILPSPAPQVLVNELAPGAINLLIHCWASKGDYAAVFHENQEALTELLNRHEIAAPTPRNEISLVTQGGEPPARP